MFLVVLGYICMQRMCVIMVTCMQRYLTDSNVEMICNDFETYLLISWS